MNENVSELFYGAEDITVDQLVAIYLANMPKWIFFISNEFIQYIIATYCINKAVKHIERYKEVIS